MHQSSFGLLAEEQRSAVWRTLKDEFGVVVMTLPSDCELKATS